MRREIRSLPVLHRVSIFTFCSLLLTAMTALCDESANNRSSDYILATGFTGGTYYHAGLAIATQIDVRMMPYNEFGLVARPTAGSVENIQMLENGKADMAILQNYVVAGLRKPGQETALAGHVPLASIGWLWKNVEHFLLDRQYVSDGTLSDLHHVIGKPVYLGAKSSGTRLSTTLILGSLGIHFPDEDMVFTNYDGAVGELDHESIVFASLPGGDPVSAVARAFATLGPSVSMLEVTDDELKSIQEMAPQWKRAVIPAGTYPLQTTDVASIAQYNLLVVRADMPVEDVYLITKEIYNNADRLSKVHPALLELADTIENIDQIWPPLHPGAARYFTERENALRENETSPSESAQPTLSQKP